MKCLNQKLLKEKSIVALAFGLLLVATIASPAPAQDQQTSIEGRTPPSPTQVVNFLGNKLNLTDDQKSQILPIIADRQQKMQALRADTSMRPLQKKRKMKAILSDSDKKINAVLNNEQKKQYAQIEEQMRQRRQEQMQD